MDNMTYVVNEADEIIGEIPENETLHNRNIITRAVAVFVFNSKEEILLQKRSKSKFRFPLHWTCSASGFVDKGEEYTDSALRELREELQLDIVETEIHFLFKKMINIDIKHMVSVYKVVYDKKLDVHNIEVDDARFCSKNDIKKMIARGERFTPFFLELFNEIYS